MIRDILKWPAAKLYDISKPVEDFGLDFKRLVDDMFETMYEHGGIGLAAIQIGVPLRVFVATVGPEEWVFANPTWERDPIESKELKAAEGCLSVPGFFEDVTRWSRVVVTFQDRHGIKMVQNTHYTTASFGMRELLARVVQHETEHLNGHLFLEHLPTVLRDKARKMMGKK